MAFVRPMHDPAPLELAGLRGFQSPRVTREMDTPPAGRGYLTDRGDGPYEAGTRT